MPYPVYPHQPRLVIYRIEDAVVAFADPVTIRAEELLGSRGTGIVGQVINDRDQAADDLLGEIQEILPRPRFELDPVGQLLELFLEGFPGMKARRLLHRLAQIVGVPKIFDLLA